VITLLLLAFALYRRSDDIARAALLLAALVGAASLAVYFTGEPAESLIEHLPGFSEAVVERHEDAALVATLVAGATGILALVILALHRHGRRIPRRTIAAAAGFALIGCGAMGYTAYLGGQVRHTEIRANAGAAQVPIEQGEEGR
jgi:drug/metabolite transporter (DMT)-like permease